MNIADAYALLGLGMRATVAEIEARFRELAQTAHPDTGGSDLAMKQLNAAREIAIDFANTKNSLVVLGVGEPTPATHIDLRASSDRAFSRVLRHHVGRLRALQRLSAALAAVGVFAGLLAGRLVPLAGAVGFDLGGPAGLAMVALGAPFLLVTGAVQLAVWSLKSATEDMNEALSDRSTFVDVISELNLDLEAPIRLANLESAIRWWTTGRIAASDEYVSLSRLIGMTRRNPFGSSTPLRQLAIRIGSRDFARLLLAKGEEVGLLRRGERFEGGRLLTEFTLVLPTSPGDAPSGRAESSSRPTN